MNPFVWGATHGENVAPPGVTATLVERALKARPDNALLHAKLGYVSLDLYDSAEAARNFEQVLAREPGDRRAAVLLARCYNLQRRYAQALDVLKGLPGAEYERGDALAGLGRESEAEAEYRAVLADNAYDHHACRKLCRSLRRAGRIVELLETCEGLAAKGVRHTALLYYWGWALALTGDEARARRILFTPERIVQTELPVPRGFATRAVFNRALAEELLGNPHVISDFPQEDEANRGSRRVESLFAGKRPDLIRLLLSSIQNAVSANLQPRLQGFDPWAEARPSSVHLKAWGLVQRAGQYEEWHIHRGGWLSGVYYLQVPSCVSADDGQGCIEFGAPPALHSAKPGLVPRWRFAPREGALLLAPSHFPHRTIPMQRDGLRISFAFDVVPDRSPSS